MAEQVHSHSAEGMIAYLEQWESQHLNKAKPHQANQDIALVQDCVRKIGERWSRRQLNENRDKCAQCGKPLSRGVPYMTIPTPDPLNGGQWINRHACSEDCSRKLQAKANSMSAKALPGD